jgi:hypothetical protein
LICVAYREAYFIGSSYLTAHASLEKDCTVAVHVLEALRHTSGSKPGRRARARV